MSNLPAIPLNTLLNKIMEAFDLTALGRLRNDTDEISHLDEAKSIKDKIYNYGPIADYRKHTLHYVMKSLGHLPTPLLNSLIEYLDGPTSKQYLHVDAHLRLILAVNSKLKKPLQISQMAELRKKFAVDAVAMQSPQVWRKATSPIKHNLSPLKCASKKKPSQVNWQDETIANADNGSMRVRCYHTGAEQVDFRNQTVRTTTDSLYNPDEIVMLFFHGGGFCIGDVDTHHEFCHSFCAQTGWPIVSVDYRLAPEHPSPAALRDCSHAYSWVVKNCHSLGASPDRIVIAGDSAGGGLSTLIAQQVSTPTEEAWADLGADGQTTFDLLKALPSPLAQLLLYPVTDVENDYPSWELYGEGLLLEHEDVAIFDAACLDHSPLPRQHVLNSPMFGNNDHVCPTYVVTAELDVLRDEAFAYAKQLHSHGVKVKTHIVLGAPHGFINLMSVHKKLGDETKHIIEGFSNFARRLIKKEKSGLSSSANPL